MVDVHCRIGSSEILTSGAMRLNYVHCRIGSAEMVARIKAASPHVHCRIGSSENVGNAASLPVVCSLPHRQLRKFSGHVFHG